MPRQLRNVSESAGYHRALTIVCFKAISVPIKATLSGSPRWRSRV